MVIGDPLAEFPEEDAFRDEAPREVDLLLQPLPEPSLPRALGLGLGVGSGFGLGYPNPPLPRYGFVSYSSAEMADIAIENMNGALTLLSFRIQSVP